MGERVRTRKSHQDVTGPDGPRGGLGQLREVRGRPLPTTFAGGSEEAWREVSGRKVRPSEVDEPGAQREVRLEASREVQLSAPAETRREVRLQRLRMAEAE